MRNSSEFNFQKALFRLNSTTLKSLILYTITLIYKFIRINNFKMVFFSLMNIFISQNKFLNQQIDLIIINFSRCYNYLM